MASDDAKLKFLPRHLQRSQPAHAPKSKRRVTVEDENAGDEESDRRSVFERLGPGGSQRNEKVKLCFEFQERGECSYGKNCVYSHAVKERSKRDGDTSPDNLRLKFKGGKDRENKVRSQVVVRKPGGGSDDDSGEDSDSWSLDKLESKKELELEQKRQEIQRALIALEAGEEVQVEPRKSESSVSESSPERTHKKKKDKASKKKEKKKHKKAAAEKEQPAEKSKEGKRRHESDDDDVVPHKKRKKKNKEKKHAEEAPTPMAIEPVGKQKKGSQVKGGKPSSDLYDPESPTSLPRGGSPDDKRSSSSSSPKAKGKGKKKKKKQMKNQGEGTGKSKKLLSPLKKVLKQKKGPDSITSSKRSRSPSRDSPPRRHHRSRSPSSSSSSSTSQSPVRKRKVTSGASQDRGRKKSKSLEKKRRLKSNQRSVSSASSSSSSSSSSSATNRAGRRIKKVSRSNDRSDSRAQKTRSPIASTVRRDVKMEKKKRGGSSESWAKGKDGEMKRGGHQSLDRGRQKERDRKVDKDAARRNLSQTSSHLGKDNRQDSRERRREGREQKDVKVAGRESGRPGDARRDARDREGDKGERGGQLRRDDNRERERERESGRGDHHRGGSLPRERDREREKRGGSLDRERDERNRRSGGFNPPHPLSQQGDRGGRFSQRGAEDDRDRDRRSFEEPAGRYPPSEGPRMGQFPDRDRMRGGFDRAGPGRGDGPGRGGRDWDERGRRDGGDSFRDEWEGGRDSRGGFGGGFRDDGGRDYPGGRDDRRGGREERLLPHLGGGSDPGKGPLMGSDPRDRPQQRGPGFRDDFGGRDSGERRDWKQREGSHESASRRSASREGGRGGRDNGDGRSRGPARPASEISSKDNKGPDRMKGLDKSGSGTKQSAVMKVKTESGQEDSPSGRDETSLASLFSQTETAPVKKKAAKTFGGKKGLKKSGEEAKPSEKAKPGLTGRAAARGRRIADRKGQPSRTSDTDRGKEAEKDEVKGIKKDDAGKEKTSRSPSPKGSQKSGDSRHSQSKSSRMSSKSPVPKRASARSPVTKLAPDSLKSPRKPSSSPAPSTGRDRSKGDVAKSPAPSTGSGRDRRKREDVRRNDEKSKVSDRGKKRERSRSHSRSGSESRRSSHSGGLEEKRRRKSSEDNESLPAKLDGGDIAAAMLGDGLDDGQPDVFSDWSDDDDADQILIAGKSKRNEVEDLDNQGYDFDMGPRSRRSPASNSRYSDSRDNRMDLDNRSIVDAVVEKPAIEKNIPNLKIVDDIQKEKPAKEKRRRNADSEGYEEISSDENELDEEGERVSKRTIVSILDIDMASLMPAVKPKTTAGPTFQRYKAASVFAEMGLSRAFAGEKLFNEVQEVCQKQVEEMSAAERTDEIQETTKADTSDTSASDMKPKLESLDSTDVKTVSGTDSVTNSGTSEETDNSALKSDEALKQEKPSSLPTSPKKSLGSRTVDPSKLGTSSALTKSTKPVFKLYSDTSAYHKLFKAKAHERSGLLAHFGMFRRALTARKDLDIRRQLCGIDPKYDQSAVYPSGAVDPEIFRLSLQLFKQKRPALLGGKPATASVT